MRIVSLQDSLRLWDCEETKDGALAISCTVVRAGWWYIDCSPGWLGYNWGSVSFDCHWATIIWYWYIYYLHSCHCHSQGSGATLSSAEQTVFSSKIMGKLVNLVLCEELLPRLTRTVGITRVSTRSSVWKTHFSSHQPRRCCGCES